MFDSSRNLRWTICGAMIVALLLSMPAGVTAETSQGGQLARLVRNPDQDAGLPPYALADRSGTIQRYVEPVPGIPLESHLNQIVVVRQDTGRTLLASQLELPQREATAPATSFGDFDAYPPSANQSAADDRVQQAEFAGFSEQFHEEIPLPQPVGPLEPLDGGLRQPGLVDMGPSSVAPIYLDNLESGALGGSCGPDGCGSSCATCGPCRTPGPCACGVRGRFYGGVEYLYWWFDGFHTPPLVTTSSVEDEGVLYRPTTTVLVGDEDILDNGRSGGRIHLGAWLDKCNCLAVEGDYFLFEDDTLHYTQSGINGAPLLARPFFNLVPVEVVETDNGEVEIVLPPEYDSQLVSFPDTVEGTVTVSARSEFRGAGLRLRGNLCCQELGTGYVRDACGTCRRLPPWGASRIDGLVGYRYLHLDERLSVTGSLTSLLPPPDSGQFFIMDLFDTSNEFHGGEIGAVWDVELKKWSFELLGKIALGVTKQKAAISGLTTISSGGNDVVEQAGILAVGSNSGSYQHDVFSVVPELGATVGYHVTKNLRASVGYTFIYWSRVARPGDQVDLDVNPNQFAPVVDFGPDRPTFAFHDTDFYAHGLRAGLDFRY